MKFRLIEKEIDLSSAYTAYSDAIDVGGAGGDSISVTASVDVATPSAKTFDSGESQVTTLTFDTKANTAAGDYVVIYDTEGGAWAVAADKSGSDPAPTGAVWAAIPAGQKAQADLQAATSAAEVAAAFELAFDALADVPFATDDSADDGTMLITMTLRGPADEAETYTANDSGAGSIAEVLTNLGVASEVDADTDELTIPSHGLTEGLKGQLTTTGTLPTGLSLATDYFVIVVDENTIQLASSLANAQAGTAVDIESQGADGSVNTFTPTSIAGGGINLQETDADPAKYDLWTDVASATAITADATVYLSKDRPAARWYRVKLALTAGYISSTLHLLVKGDRE
jgi:hypothetical protein